MVKSYDLPSPLDRSGAYYDVCKKIVEASLHCCDGYTAGSNFCAAFSMPRLSETIFLYQIASDIEDEGVRIYADQLDINKKRIQPR